MYKEKVHTAVLQYRRLFPEEYIAVTEQVKLKRQALVDTKFATTEKHVVSMDRALAEYPETLYHAINQLLTEEEFKEFSTLKGQRWFAKKYRDFRIPEKI